MDDEYYILQPNEDLALTYHVMPGNGEWSRSELEEYVAVHQRSK